MADMVIVEGVVKEDGTLEVREKVSLPQGRVQVILQPLPDLPPDDPFWQRMQALWDAQKARGHVPRGVEEVESERQAFREEWEERMREMERIQEEARAARKRPEQDA